MHISKERGATCTVTKIARKYYVYQEQGDVAQSLA